MSVVCLRCNGSGRELCTFCGGFSRKPMGDSCPYCNDRGIITCKSCRGSGKSSSNISGNGLK